MSTSPGTCDEVVSEAGTLKLMGVHQEVVSSVCFSDGKESTPDILAIDPACVFRLAIHVSKVIYRVHKDDRPRVDKKNSWYKKGSHGRKAREWQEWQT